MARCSGGHLETGKEIGRSSLESLASMAATLSIIMFLLIIAWDESLIEHPPASALIAAHVSDLYEIPENPCSLSRSAYQRAGGTTTFGSY